MLKVGNSTSTVLTANEVIPLNVIKNTNNKMVLNNNNIIVNVGGLVKIDAMFTIEASEVGEITIQLYDGTTPIDNVKSTNSFTAVGDILTFNLTDIEQVINTYASTNTSLNFVISGACTMTNALVTFVYEQ